VVDEALSLQAHPHAIDAREKRIAAELADADAKKAEAQKERDAFSTRTRSSTSSAPRS
jgi:F0F1-type ATP synthase membrane subunit b/b'